MASVNAANYTKSITVPIDKIDAGEMNCRVKFIYDSYTYAAAIAINTEILSMNIPENAFVVDAFILASDGGGTGKFSLGHKASADATSETEDLDSLVVECDAGAAAAYTKAIVSSAKLFARYTKPVQLVCACTEATTATSGTVEFGVWYTLEF